MNRLLVFATVSVGVFAIVVIVLAANPTNQIYAANPSVTPKGIQIAQELKEKRCDRISAFIDTRIERYNENKDRHSQNHKKILEKIQNLITSMKAKGLDVTKLESDYNSLFGMTETFSTKYYSFINKLEEAKGLGCQESEGLFTTTMAQSRAILKEARDQAQEIWKYINTIIRKDIEDLRILANQQVEIN
jgi:hypothetical protein